MSDRRYPRRFANSSLGGASIQAPRAARAAAARRYEPGQPLVSGPACWSARRRRPPRRAAALVCCDRSGAHGPTTDADAGRGEPAAARSSTRRGIVERARPARAPPTSSTRLIRMRWRPIGPHRSCSATARARPRRRAAATAQRALEGFTRSARQGDRRHGATAQLVRRRATGGEHGHRVDAALPALAALGVRARAGASTSGAAGGARRSRRRPTGTRRSPADVAVVTGAARGIGAAIAATLARDGAARHLRRRARRRRRPWRAVANAIGGTRLQLDITADDAPAAPRRARRAAPRRARRRRAQRGHHPRQDAGQHGRASAGTR